jgi:hypothetical protein
MRDMRRSLERFIPILLLVVFGVALGSVALESDDHAPDPPNHYDGDDDDAGNVGKIFSHDVDVVVTVSSPLFVPSAPGLLLAAIRQLRPPEVIRGPFGSRSPPA